MISARRSSGSTCSAATRSPGRSIARSGTSRSRCRWGRDSRVWHRVEGPRPTRRALRARRRPGREPAAPERCRGRGARARGRLDARGGARGRGRPATATSSGAPASHDDVWVGSHLDTVPRGGRFDGALGVVAAIEAVERTGAGSVVVFRGEEVGCVGSRALVARGSALAARVSRAPCRAGSRARGCRRAARSRDRDRRLCARRARPRGSRGARGDDADGGSRGRARRGGRRDPARP